MRHAHIVVDEDVNLIKTWVERVKKMDDNGAAFFLVPSQPHSMELKCNEVTIVTKVYSIECYMEKRRWGENKSVNYRHKEFY